MYRHASGKDIMDMTRDAAYVVPKRKGHSNDPDLPELQITGWA